MPMPPEKSVRQQQKTIATKQQRRRQKIEKSNEDEMAVIRILQTCMPQSRPKIQ
jgi:hypothetical protein